MVSRKPTFVLSSSLASVPFLLAMTPLTSYLFLLIFFLFFTYSSTSSTCYKYDGNIDGYPSKCPNSDMCCYLSRTDGYLDDECIQGICLSSAGEQAGLYFVVACTDSNRESEACSAAWKVCGMSYCCEAYAASLVICILIKQRR